MFGTLSLLRSFGGRKIASAPVIPADTFDQLNLYTEQALEGVNSVLKPALLQAQSSLLQVQSSLLHATGQVWGWQHWFVLTLCLLYLVFAALTVTRARREHRRRLRNVRQMSLEQLKMELEALVAEGRSRLATGNKLSLTGPLNDTIDTEVDGVGDTPGWQWREIRDHVLRQRHF